MMLRYLLAAAASASLLVASVRDVAALESDFGGDSLIALIRDGAPEAALWDLQRWRPELLRLYADRSDRPLWFERGRLSRAGDRLLEALSKVDTRGLLPADYDVRRLRELVQAARGAGGGARAIARADVAMSLVAARVAADLQRGRVSPASVGHELDVPRPPFDAIDAVGRLAASRDAAATLDSFEPAWEHYVLLKHSLARHREIALSLADVPLPPAPARSVRTGDVYEGSRLLERLLVAMGDLAPADRARRAGGDVFDAVLAAAVQRFQARHGLEADGVFGSKTHRALAVPMTTRIRQIELSLERLRWLPPLDGRPPIFVNIPQFRLFAFRTNRDRAEDILQMDVVVGADYEGRRTPVFAADMTHIIVHPYWDVPRSILVKELLPDIRRDPRWIERNGYEIVAGQTDSAKPLPVTPENIALLASGRLRLRQAPGPQNALGNVKFMFPNRHNVYLHDTPARSLFGRSRRDFSHGCIRVADPLALLDHLMRDDPTWTAERRQRALSSSTPQRLQLSAPVRVFIVYATALASEAGETLFFDDIYEQDARLAQLIDGRAKRGTARP